MKRPLLFVCCCLAACYSGKAQYVEEDWRDRDKWMNVPRLFEMAGVQDGDIVADIGCHQGYLSVRLAKEVGPNGKVFAVDVRQSRLAALEENAKKRRLGNITTILGDYDNPKLGKNTLDVVFVIDTYHEMDEYMTILDHIKKALRPGGKLVILEKLKSAKKNKSRKEQTNAHTLGPEYVREEMERAGFTVTKEVKNLGNWENESSKKMWLLIAVTPDT